MTVLITLTTAGADSGPFDLYSNLDGYVSAFATGVSKSALLAGYSSAAVPDFTTTIRVKSNGDCVNYIDIVLTGLTTTTTTTAPSGCTAYTIYNGAGADEPYSYTACGGGFVGTFIGGFSSDGPFCAVTGSLVIGGSISITLEEPCSAPATTTTTTTAAPVLEAGGISSASLTDPSTGCSLTIDSICYFDTAVEGVVTSGDIVYNNIDGTSPINGGGLYYSVNINSISGFYQYVVLINSVGVMTVYSTCP